MRLLLITKDFAPDVGGIQSYAWALAQRWVKGCASFCLVAPKLPGSAEVDARAPFPVYRVPCTRNSFAALTALHLPVLRARYGFDTVFGAQWQSAMPALSARAYVKGLRVFSAVHGREILTEHFEKLPLGAQSFAAARRHTLASVDGLYPGSHYALDLLHEGGFSYRRVTVTPHGCDAERFRPADGTPVREKLGLGTRPVVLTVCRLVPRKGVDTVLRALPAVRAAMPDVVYLIGGSGPDEARLKALASELGLGDSVRFLGRVPDADMLATYGAADLFALAAREERPDVEGFGLVYLEANACGKAVVGTTSGGVPDAVVHGKTGLLVPPEDVPAFAAAIVELLRDPARLRAMGDAGRARAVGEASWDHVAGKLLASLEASSS